MESDPKRIVISGIADAFHLFVTYRYPRIPGAGPGQPGGQDEHPGAALLDLYRHPRVRLRARVPPGPQAPRQGQRTGQQFLI